MDADLEVYRKLSALHAQGRPCLIYTGGKIYHVQEIEELAPSDTAVATVKARCEDDEIQHIVLSQIEAVVERGGHVA